MKKFAAFLFALFAALSFAAPCDAASPVRFHVLSVSFTDEAAVVEGEIINEKAIPVRVGAAEVFAKITDANGDTLIDNAYRFDGLDVTVSANDTGAYTFTLPREDTSAYDGRFQWRIQSRIKWTEA